MAFRIIEYSNNRIIFIVLFSVYMADFYNLVKKYTEFN